MLVLAEDDGSGEQGEVTVFSFDASFETTGVDYSLNKHKADLENKVNSRHAKFSDFTYTKNADDGDSHEWSVEAKAEYTAKCTDNDQCKDDAEGAITRVKYFLETNTKSIMKYRPW